MRNQLSFPSSVLLLLAACIKLTGAENDLSVVQKVFMPQRLHLGNTGIHLLQPIDEASWIWHPECDPVPATARAEVFSSGWRQPVLLRFRQGFTAASASCRIHVSADERFELFVDGHRIARGPDRSDVQHWCYATYDLKLAPGNHRMEALVWNIGPNQPVAQLSWRGGFVLKAEGEYDRQLTTGKAAWEVARLAGCEFTPGVFFVGAQLTARDCGPQWKEGDYVKAVTVRGPVRDTPYGESVPGWLLFPTRLPDQLDVELVPGRAMAVGSGWLGRDVAVTAEQASHPELPAWQAVVEGKKELIVPANTERFLLWDLEN